MKYTLHTLKDENNDPLYCILENATEQVVDAFLFKDDAHRRFKFLTRGGAFDGFTPAFILKKVSPPNNPNKEFERTVLQE